jgi:hypothetical protein
MLFREKIAVYCENHNKAQVTAAIKMKSQLYVKAGDAKRHCGILNG